MNTPSSPVTACASQLNRFARENPTRSVLVAIGFGFAAALLVRALQPRPPASRAARLLADLQDRLHAIAAPAHRQADHLVANGADTVRNGVAHFHELQLERGFRKLARRCQNLFR